MQSLANEDLETLNRCILFRKLDTNTLIPLLAGTVTAWPAGHFLVHEGEVLDSVTVVLSGSLHASCFDRSGKEFLYQQILPSYLAGGEVVCTPRKTCPYNIYVNTDCRLWSFPWALLENDSTLPVEIRLQLIQNLLSFIANQNIRKYYKIEALSIKSARERIMKYLTAQSIRIGSTSFTIPMDRESMANYLCLNRSVLSHELKQMEEDGLIHFHKNHFTLLSQRHPSKAQNRLKGANETV